MKKYQAIAIVAALPLLAAACQSEPLPTVQAATAAQPPTEAPAFPQESEAQAPTSEPIAPVEQEPAAPVEVREGLVATNPATVHLASGTPTLVEFFAFW
ncbi:MAG: hypothetical protein V3U32_04955 [Anaerolineales bacterium]